MRLKDQVVIVTGGAVGLGRVYARRFLEEGARVMLADVADAGPALQKLAPYGEVHAVLDHVQPIGAGRMVPLELVAHQARNAHDLARAAPVQELALQLQEKRMPPEPARQALQASQLRREARSWPA